MGPFVTVLGPFVTIVTTFVTTLSGLASQPPIFVTMLVIGNQLFKAFLCNIFGQ